MGHKYMSDVWIKVKLVESVCTHPFSSVRTGLWGPGCEGKGMTSDLSVMVNEPWFPWLSAWQNIPGLSPFFLGRCLWIFVNSLPGPFYFHSLENRTSHLGDCELTKTKQFETIKTGISDNMKFHPEMMLTVTFSLCVQSSKLSVTHWWPRPLVSTYNSKRLFKYLLHPMYLFNVTKGFSSQKVSQNFSWAQYTSTSPYRSLL